MKRKPVIISLAAIAVAAVTFFTIRAINRQSDFIDPAFREYISAYSAGFLSVNSTIRIELAKEIPNVELNKPIDGKLFSFSPSIEGQAYWVDTRTIEFRPAKPMEPATEYKVKFYLSKVMTVPRKFKTFRYSFETIKQAVSVSVKGYQPYAITNMNWNTVNGEVLTADYAADEQVEKIITAEQDGKNLSVKWTHNENSQVHHFVIDSVYRGEKSSEVLVKWNGSSIGVDESGTEKVTIPAITEFYAIEAKVVHDAEQQYVLIRFTDPLDHKQNLNGLIHSNEIPNFTLEIDGVEVKAYPENVYTGSATIIVEEGILNIAGAALKKQQEFEVNFENMKPAVRIAGKGVILPNSKGLILPFEAVNLRAVDLRIIKIYENNIGQFLQINQLDGNYELRRAGRLILKKTIRLGTEKPIVYNKWNSFSLDLSKLIEQEPGAIYRVQLSFRMKYSAYQCNDENTEEIEGEDLTTIDEVSQLDMEAEMAKYDEPRNYYYDDDYEYYGGDYNWEEREDPCKPSYYYGNERTASRNILASDIGIIAKANPTNSLTVAVSNLVTTKPISGAEIQVFNYQNQEIGKGTSDNNGLCNISCKGKGFLLVVKNGTQKGYLRIDDGNALSLSNFDVSGQVIQKGLKGFIYGERGVWRPGDSIFLTFILEDKLGQLPASHPVILELINPQGKKVKQITKTASENGFYCYRFTTSDNDITGNYMANIKIGGSIFSKTLKIETVKPNRLKIAFDFGTEILTNQSQTAKLNVKWLHGAPARNMKANVAVSLSSTTTSFKGYDGYVFTDPTKVFSAEEQTVFDGTVNENGEATVTADISAGENAPGLLRANFVTRVFEPGGEFSVDRLNIVYSPYDNYVGLKSPEGKYNYLYTDTNQIFEVATLTAEGKPVNCQNLDFKVFKLDWRWWWSSSDEELANFTSNTYRTPFFSTRVSTTNGKARVPFKLSYPNWGRYLVMVTDPKGGHSTANIVYFDWPSYRSRGNRDDSKGSTMLTFSSDKKTYTVGDKATITVPSAPGSRLLVSIESGSDILKTWWVEADSKTETKVSFDVTENMTPNVYVNVALVQPHAQVHNDAPMRLYGVIPIMVENPGAHLNPVITMPDVIKPEEKFTVKINEKNNKPMTYTLAIVDDGLLDLTRYKTPDPYSAFNGREALGIRTWDLYDLVLGAYGKEIEQLFAIGGDDELKGKGGAKAQRFKPIVKYLGPFTLKSGSQSHAIQLPPYIGSVRVMVVAAHKGTFGSTEKTVPVRKPLMVLATLPRVLGPGEEVDLPVTVFAMDKSIKRFNAEVAVNEFFTLVGEKSKTIQVNEMGEFDFSFRLKVTSKTGVGKVKVTVASGREKSEYDIEIQVRNPNPRMVKYAETTLDPNTKGSLSYTLEGMQGTNKATLEVSSLPPIDFTRRIEYLLTYPYGCAEQTTSSAFPQLYVDKFIQLSDFDTKRRDEHINFAIRKLSGMQDSEGGVVYWPGMSYADDWITSYVGHFMLEAQKKGFQLPAGFLNNWIKYQKKLARRWEPNKDYYSDLMQSYRLYTLALAQNPDLGAMNRLKERKDLSAEASWRLAAAYALNGQNDVARQLIQGKPTENKSYTRFNVTYGSIERDWALILETLCLLNDKTTAFQMVKKISASLSSDYWYSTQTTAYCLMSISKFIEMGKLSNEIKFSWQMSGKGAEQVSTRLPIARVPLPANQLGTFSINLNNLAKGTLFVRVVTEGIPETGPVTGYENNMKMGVVFKSLNGKDVVDVSSLEQGTDFVAYVTVQNSFPLSNITNIALSQIFPSGWEISNSRFLNEDGEDPQQENYTYRDIRDDRVNTFFDLALGETRTFKVKLTATYSGRFYLPGVLCEAMYEPGVNAFVPGKWIEVVK